MIGSIVLYRHHIDGKIRKLPMIVTGVEPDGMLSGFMFPNSRHRPHFLEGVRVFDPIDVSDDENAQPGTWELPAQNALESLQVFTGPFAAQNAAEQAERAARNADPDKTTPGQPAQPTAPQPPPGRDPDSAQDATPGQPAQPPPEQLPPGQDPTGREPLPGQPADQQAG